MRALLSLIGILSFLTGCGSASTSTSGGYGNFIPSALAAHEKQLADDAARQLQLLYPPASTRLDLRQSAPDGFGKQLVETLRSQGYALREVPPAVGPAAAESHAAPAASASGASASIPFNYVLDSITSPKLYRVTLVLGSQTMTRAYVPQSEAVHPAGAWVRKE
ncbi:conjugal transfer protein TrbH [Pseudoduganella aquatica]|uniref:Conjugal transfer protein TrbH n=1 Tax=Pseudoduganella aquatica TaxID=2660641 RepID=A0A7X4KM57_9BURK|nr:conjugal transfer protein TrbH [Pseudoduganella aquatica]MYN08904.1 conjugal transfer protein TrbH [Pseudoduganella aquatica]